MAWSTPLTAVSNATLTAAQWNASVRDNLLETAPAKATTGGGIFVATGTNAIAQRIPSSATVATSQTTTTTGSYGDLATVGPAVTVTTGTQAIVMYGANISNGTNAGGGQMSYAVSGASTVAAADSTACRSDSSTAGDVDRAFAINFQTGLTAGSNTFTAKYTTPNGGTATFSDRHLIVIPL